MYRGNEPIARQQKKTGPFFTYYILLYETEHGSKQAHFHNAMAQGNVIE